MTDAELMTRDDQKPRLSLCLIARDEAEDLPRCLKSVQGVVDEIILADTGSRDATVEIARSFGAKAVSVPWTGSFSEARNASIDAATGDWILALDPDEELSPGDRDRLRPLLEKPGVDAYVFLVVSYVGATADKDTEITCSIRLWRNRPEYRYSGSIHEQWAEQLFGTPSEPRIMATGLSVLHYGYLDSRISAKDKKARNLSILQDEVRKRPRDNYLRYNLGIEHFRAGRDREALREFKKAWKGLTPGSMWSSALSKMTALTLMTLGEFAEAEKYLEKGLRLYPDFTDLVFLKGTLHTRQGQYPLAVEAFRRCAAMGPAPVPPYSADSGLGGYKAHFALGQVYEAMGNQAESARSYFECYKTNTGHLQALYRLASVLAQEGDLAGVRVLFEKFFDLSRADHLVTLSDILYTVGDYDGALNYLNLSGNDTSHSEAVLFLRGLSLMKTGRFEEAIQSLSCVSAESIRHSEACLSLAYCHFNLDQPEEAARMMARVSDREQARRILSQLFLQDAASVLRDGLKRFPESAPLRHELEEVLREARSASGRASGSPSESGQSG